MVGAMTKTIAVIVMVIGGLIYLGVFRLHNFPKKDSNKSEAPKSFLPFNLPLKLFLGYILGAFVILIGFGSYNGIL